MDRIIWSAIAAAVVLTVAGVLLLLGYVAQAEVVALIGVGTAVLSTRA